MMESLVLTVIGPDKPGVVDTLSKVVADHGASWEESRMARLAGQFAGILLVSVEPAQREPLSRALEALSEVKVILVQGVSDAEAPAARLAHLDLVGSDRPGIVQRLSRALAQRGVNVEELETEVVRAPMSSELLFQARARLTIPADVALEQVREDLEAIAGDLMVDVTLEAAAGHT